MRYLVLMLMAIALIGCEGNQGPTGPAGQTGLTGPPGIPGTGNVVVYVTAEKIPATPNPIVYTIPEVDTSNPPLIAVYISVDGSFFSQLDGLETTEVGLDYAPCWFFDLDTGIIALFDCEGFYAMFVIAT